MRKLFLFTLLTIMVHNVYAQRKIEYGFQLGGGLAIQRVDNSAILSNHSIRTFNANAIVNLPVWQHYYISFRPGITNKGTEITEDALTTTNHITYYEIPVYLIRKYSIPGFGKVMGGIGIHAAMGAGGRLEFVTPSSTNSDKILFGDDKDFHRYDAGLNVITGLELNNRLTFTLGYDLGLVNIASQTLKDIASQTNIGTGSIYNRSFVIGLGLLF